MTPETNGYRELLLRSMLDAIGDLRRGLQNLEQRQARLEERMVSPNGSSRTPDRTGEPWRLLDRAVSIGPMLWSVTLWIWHAMLWLIPGVLAGWGAVEGWWAIAWRLARDLYP